ncbi:putative G-protein coupled receptor Mth-like 3 [Oratosquilla oratoria]|uniref:putative G-protein coupled receptor Mth-like 3 n=1 Tax=Oratosquilla oratoria TaxID=337810 RepID=UPI003F7736B2
MAVKMRVDFLVVWLTVLLVVVVCDPDMPLKISPVQTKTTYVASTTSLPEVPKCCPDGQALDARGLCSSSVDDVGGEPIATSHLSLALSPGSKPFEWEEVYGVLSPLTCAPEDLIQVSVSYSQDSELILLASGVTLYSFQDREYWRNAPDFCVDSLLVNASVPVHMASFCRKPNRKVCGQAGHVCVSKCCPSAMFFDDTFRCAQRRGRSLSDFDALPNFQATQRRHWSYDVVANFPSCRFLTRLEPEATEADEYVLLDNGHLFRPRVNLTFGLDDYCLDDFAEQEGAIVRRALVCDIPYQPTLEDKLRANLYPVCLVISVVCMIVLCVLHVVVPGLRADVQGKCMFAHTAALMVAYCALFLLFVFPQFEGPFCLVTGVVIHFMFLAAFFWLSVMCFDIWRVVRVSVKGFRLQSNWKGSQSKFFAYSLYAWGCPALVTSALLILNFLPNEPQYEDIVRPHFERCWLKGDLATLLYFYGIVGLLFALNLILIVSTVVYLLQAGAGLSMPCCTSVLSSESSRSFNAQHLEAFCQRFALFAVMSICWVTEVISWQVKPYEIWIVTDLFNSLQGFFIALIFLRSAKKRQVVGEVFRTYSTRFRSAVRSRSMTTTVSGSQPPLHISNAITQTTCKPLDENASKLDQQEPNKIACVDIGALEVILEGQEVRSEPSQV